MTKNPFKDLKKTITVNGKPFEYFSLPALGERLQAPIARLPVCLRMLLESVLRNCDGDCIAEEDVTALARWRAHNPAADEIPFKVARILLQDFTGVPLLVDLAAMRAAAARLGKDPGRIEPLVPLELVIDHSVQVDVAGVAEAIERNMEIEFRRNHERYQFLKWGQHAFRNFNVIPPGIGIVHQVNLEFLARGVMAQKQGDGATLVFPDTLVGTDSHTTMINGLGVVGWGVGGIEAEAGMLGQPIYLLAPEVVGVHLRGELREGVTATDLVLRITEMLRREKVVGKFVEFFGEGARSLSVPDRATIGNMSPEYGATMGYFPWDGPSLNYLQQTGRPREQIRLIHDYLAVEGCFGIPGPGDVDYSTELELDLGTVEASVAGPKRPQDRIPLVEVADDFERVLARPLAEGGYGRSSGRLRKKIRVELPPFPCMAVPSVKGGGSQEQKHPKQAAVQETSLVTEQEMANNRPTPYRVGVMTEACGDPEVFELRDGAVLIAAITSCTNTSNPSVMLAAGLVARRAVQRGLRVRRHVKTSLAPGSRVVTEYLKKAGLQEALDQLGFNVVAYGCTTCIGNSGPLPAPIERALLESDIVAASVLSGNRNFEARIHALVRANYLMSPPLVVAFALAGRIDINLEREPLGIDNKGRPVFLADLWPTEEELRAAMADALASETFKRLYSNLTDQNPVWKQIPAASGQLYQWTPSSTYIQEPPFFEAFSITPPPIQDLIDGRALAMFGDSVTTDHISPAGSIKNNSPAGEYLLEHGVPVEEFNSYGSRRGNDRVMTRGTFANLRIRNLMVPGVEGGYTRNVLSGSSDPISVFDAAQIYRHHRVPLLVFAGKEYGTGSSRDWAAKGTRLLGVRIVIAESFERIHRSNLVGMGVLPCCFMNGTNAAKLGLDGSEQFSVLGLKDGIEPREMLTMNIKRAYGDQQQVPVQARLDTPMEIEYYRHGGILPYMLRQLIG